jgi:uncharacterized RDD family membrane protein YckC
MMEKMKCSECGGELAGEGAVCPQCGANGGEKPHLGRTTIGATGDDHRSKNGNGAGVEELLVTVDHTPRGQMANSTTPAEIGEFLGAYKIIRALGKGGMGSVFEAEELESGRRVALKLFGQSLDSSDARQRFLREGRLAASISHPNTVYVYGTEEINGVPAISMELVPGGTLEAKVRESGPMNVGPAVDTILQIIDGLEAAQKRGVLHRDIKASNCFLDSSGAVKVGDFGLSVSTIAKFDLKLTSTGSFVGTPSYASPEQLRGQEMDVRSDIYSIGVTLFYLLTGKIPFEADSFVQLIAAVLEQPTPNASLLRKEVPRELALVVSKCLEKQPAKRFQSYEELRAALQPFTSAAPVPAPIPLRMLAGLIDNVLLFGMAMLQTAIVSAFGVNALQTNFIGTQLHIQLYAISLVWTICYYVVSEAVWGATIGKSLCGLRVIGQNRGRPSVVSALIRAAIYYSVPCLPTWLMLGFRPPVTGSNSLDLGMIALALAIYPMLGSLFLTCRKRNGYAAVHDLASATRVTLKGEKELRPQNKSALVSATESVPSDRIGPYRILRTLDQHWLLGHDDKLARDVWIRRCAGNAPPFPSAAGQVARVGRLRWLGGKRDDAGGWDAFEALTGAPLLTCLNQPQRWDVVRFWLADLAQELAACDADHSLPTTLSLNRIWITSENRAKLLDAPAPGFAEGEVPLSRTPDAPVDDRPRLLLRSLAASALTGTKAGNLDIKKLNHNGALPLHAFPILTGIAQLPPTEQTAAALSGVLRKRVRVSRMRRLALVAVCLAFPLVTSLVPYFFTVFVRQWEKAMPNVATIHSLMELITENPLINSSKKTLKGAEREAVEILIASKYAADIENPAVWDSLYANNTILPWERVAAKKILEQRKPSSADEVAESEAIVEAILKKRGESRPLSQLHPLMALLSFMTASTIMYAAAPALVAALTFRGGLFLALLGMVAVDRHGRPASRLRMTWRTIVAWGTTPLFIFLAVSLMPWVGQGAAAGIALALFLGLFLLSPLLPVRGIPDRLAGTWLVMK